MRLLSCVAASATITVSPAALAQGFTPDTHRSQVGATPAVWAIHSPGTVMPVVHFGSIRVPRREEVAAQFDIDLPTALWFDGPGGENRATIANPTLGVRLAPVTGPVAWWVGGRISAP